MFTDEAADSIGSNHSIGVNCGTVLETDGDGRALLILEVFDPFVNMRTLRRDAFDQFVEKSGTMDGP